MRAKFSTEHVSAAPVYRINVAGDDGFASLHHSVMFVVAAALDTHAGAVFIEAVAVGAAKAAGICQSAEHGRHVVAASAGH